MRKATKTKPAKAPDFTKTPEFVAAVNAGINAAVPLIVAQLNAARSDAGAAPMTATSASDTGFARGLALAISELTDPGNKRRVAPEIIEKRTQAQARMVQLILDARAAGQVGVYELRHKVYLDEILVDPVFVDRQTKMQRPTQIEWPGVPNHAMVPVNDVAKAIFAEYSTYTGQVLTKDTDPLRVTAGGLVVRGAGGIRREAPHARSEEPVGEGLRIRHRAENLDGSHNVLGTIASPARSTTPRQQPTQ